MTYLQAVILGIVQGLTEFLPISSSGHLIIVPRLFGWNEHALVFDTTLHLGTALAILFYFWKDLSKILGSVIRDAVKYKLDFKIYSSESFLGLKLLVGSVPAAILGLMFDDFIESSIRGVAFVILFSVLGTLLMIAAEYAAKKSAEIAETSLNKISFRNSFLIGVFQSLALLPGVSRSGSTISAGIFFGLTREEAARFSFLLSVPIVLAAALFKLTDSLGIISNGEITMGIIAAGLIASVVSGLLAIRFLLEFLKNHRLNIFIIYRLVLVAVLILYLL